MLRTYSEHKINNQIILKEHNDEHYEPTDEEIREYALYIGIDPDKEFELLWLAKAGLMKPLPSGWKPCQDENGELYYFNFDTGKSSWDHPYDEIFKARVIQEREKKSSLTIPFDTHSKGKDTSSISDLSTGKNPYNIPISTKNEIVDHQFDSQYINSDPDEELVSNNDFQNDIDFGIDRQLSARIEREEIESTENNERMKLANLAAQAAERRLNANKVLTSDNIPHEDIELTKLRTRLEQSANEEKLQLLEDNRIYIEKFKIELRLAKEQEERILRDQIKDDLKLFETNLRENFSEQTKSVEVYQKNELNNLKQNIEKEKQELQTKLRAGMLADLSLQQQSNTNIQIRLLQTKHESDEKLRHVENRYKSEIEDLTKRYEQIQIEKETLEKRLKEKNDFCSTLQRTMDQLRSEKSSLERKLHDAEIELKSIDDSHQQIQSSTNRTVDENSNLEPTVSHHKNTFHNDDDDEGLSDTDSDVIEMKQTLNELKHMSNRINDQKTHSFERKSNQSLIDSGHWSNTLLSTIHNNTYPLHHYQSSITKTNSWQSQPSLITREAVIKAVRDVLPPGVIDHLTSTH